MDSKQPLDAVLTAAGFSNHDLVRASTDQLTHKQVQKARKGRQLTLNVQLKILKAMHALSPEKSYNLRDLFNDHGN